VQRRAQTQVIDGRCHWPKEARELLAAQGILVLDDDLPGSIKPWFQAQQRGLEQPLELSPGVEPLSFSRGARTLTLYLLRKPEEHAYWLVLEEKEAAAATDRAFPGLDITSRESEVLYWVSQGKSNSEIATILGISGGTVGRHLENLFPKLGVANRYAAGMIASGILSMRETAAIPHHGLLHHAQSSSTG
jgi:DNA-binding CsgD family transcriptional regulator